MPERYQEMPGRRKREEYSLTAELRETVDKVLQMRSKDARRFANLLRAVAEFAPKLESAGYSIEIKFDEEEFTGADSVHEIPNYTEIFIENEEGKPEETFRVDLERDADRNDLAAEFKAKAEKILEEGVIDFPKAA